MITVQVYADAELPPAFEAQALVLVRAEWPAAFAGARRFARHIRDGHDPPHRVAAHIVATDGFVVVGYATLIDTRVTIAGEPHPYHYLTAGLSSVLTVPEFRRQGWGGRVVAAATRTIDAGAADIAILFCPPELHPFYARSGWEAVAGGTTLVGDRARPVAHEQPRMMRFHSERGRADRERLSGPLYVGAQAW